MARLQAPVVFRLRWVGGPRAGARGGVHARYIATRSGVAREAAAPDPVVHARYLDERLGSTGLFGADPAAPPALSAVQAEVRTRPWHWQAVLSLRSDDAGTLGVVTPDDWRDLARRIMPQMAALLGVAEGDLRWAAAMHRKAGHPHVHMLAWLREGVPDRRPLLTARELRAVRRVVARETYGPLRAEAVARKTAERDYLVAAGRLNLAALRRAGLEAQAEDPAGGRQPPRLPEADLRHLARSVAALAAVLPGHGRTALAYMPPDVKAQARAAADWVLARPALVPSLGAMESAVRDLTALYTTQTAAGDTAWRQARDDLRDRVAQAVLRAAVRDRPASADGRWEGRVGTQARMADLLRGAFRTAERERLRAEAHLELSRMDAAAQTEAQAARERAASMDATRRW